MGKLSVREKVLMVVLIVILLFLAYYYLFYIPNTTQIQQYKDDSASVDNQLVSVNTKIAHMQQMQAELDEILANGGEGISGLPIYDNRDAIMRSLSPILEESEGYNVSFADIKEEDGIVRRDITISYHCEEYGDAKQILENIYNIEYTCIFKDLSVANSDSQCSINLSLTYFEYK